MVQPLWKSVWRFLRKLGMTLPEETSTCKGFTYNVQFYIVLNVVINSMSYTFNTQRKWGLMNLTDYSPPLKDVKEGG